MRTFTSYILATALLAASAQAAGFCEEYTFTDGSPCTKVADNSFSCKDDVTSATVNTAGGHIQIAATLANQAGVKLDCGANGAKNVTYFVAAGGNVTFAEPPCNGSALIGVTSVRSAKQLQLPGGGQEFDFSDANACTKQADGSFLCGDSMGATLSQNTANGDILLTAGPADSAVKVSCSAGSSIYFCSGPGGSRNFTQPTCGAGFTSVVSVKSAAMILRPAGWL